MTIEVESTEMTEQLNAGRNARPAMHGVTNQAFDGGLDLVKELPIKATRVTIEDNSAANSDNLRITWTSLTWDVAVRKYDGSFPFIHNTNKRILQPQSGQMSSGQLVALMGKCDDRVDSIRICRLAESRCVLVERVVENLCGDRERVKCNYVTLRMTFALHRDSHAFIILYHASDTREDLLSHHNLYHQIGP